jgi:hypothetical protein
MIEGQHFFVLDGPRRTGKTTFFSVLMNQLNDEGEYSALMVNIRAAGGEKNPNDAMKIVADSIFKKAKRHLPEKEWPDPPDEASRNSFYQGQLQEYLNHWSEKNPKPIVLMIDEAGSLPDDLFSILLSQLNAGFEDRPYGFPHSIALTGLRPGKASFDMKAETLLLGAFTPSETDTLLNEHIMETGQIFTQRIKEEIFRLTGGQPWLTNALAKEIVSGVIKDDYTRPVEFAHLISARRNLVRRGETHMGSLSKKLREPAVKRVTEAVISGEFLPPDRLEDLIYLQDMGLVTCDPPVTFANPVYAEVIPRILNHCWEVSFHQVLVDQKRYLKNGCLDMDAVIERFQKFYRRSSDVWLQRLDFYEIGRQLLFMAFLQRIAENGGTFEYEMAIGSGHISILLEFASERFPLLLKLQRDRYSDQDALKQILHFLNQVGMDHGYLILFETNSQVPWEECAYGMEFQIPWEKRIYWKDIEQNGKKIKLIGM